MTSKGRMNYRGGCSMGCTSNQSCQAIGKGTTTSFTETRRVVRETSAGGSFEERRTRHNVPPLEAGEGPPPRRSERSKAQSRTENAKNKTNSFAPIDFTWGSPRYGPGPETPWHFYRWNEFIVSPEAETVKASDASRATRADHWISLSMRLPAPCPRGIRAQSSSRA